jgi:hypothetical protein
MLARRVTFNIAAITCATPRQMPRAVVNFLRRSQTYFDVPSIESVPIQEERSPFENVV